jgi:hypothetical protein
MLESSVLICKEKFKNRRRVAEWLISLMEDWLKKLEISF